jgi:predicted O-methyltransferase YrrM
MSIAQIIYMLFRYSTKPYTRIQKFFPKVFPPDPLKITNESKSPLIKIFMKLKIYAHTNDFEPIIKKELLFFKANQKQLGSLQSLKEIGNILDLIKKTEGIDGDIIELGVAGGGTTIMMAHFLKQINSKRKIYGCDTFEGLPYEDKFSDKASENVIGRYSNSLDAVENKLKKFNVDDKISLVKGLFEDTLHTELDQKQFSFVFVDCDLYDATKYSLEFVWPRLSKKGLIVFDEYGGGALNMKRGRWGESKAADEFCAIKKIKLHMNPEPMLIK